LGTQLAFQFARIIMAATKAGLFDALRLGGGTAEEVAVARGTDRGATTKVLDALLAHPRANFTFSFPAN
jgi:hypothetical protein